MPEYIGYHGTDNDAAEKIIANQKFIPSRGLDEWLGQGVYFFSSPEDAVWWCKANKALKLGQYKVLRATLFAKNIIDLISNRSDTENFKKFCEVVKNKCDRLPDGNKRENYMSLAIQLLLKQSRKKIDMIIAGFNKNRNFWYNVNSVLSKKFPIVVVQVQYCVLNSDCIKSIEEYEERIEDG